MEILLFNLTNIRKDVRKELYNSDRELHNSMGQEKSYYSFLYRSPYEPLVSLSLEETLIKHYLIA